ncbi:adenine deaminase [Calidithermus roseus]|uniref:Adenine deaminase n=1 Tax=Calidithermus roseus TaxID=1644118 RepID=A0A399F0L9_9DEIN|nr:adenine deaminase [Calidithermus roseus]RIH88332.1 Adenine deaminase [Calidithermus roseus]
MQRETLIHLLEVARGDAPADLVLEGTQVLNVFTGEVYPASVAIAGGFIAGVGEGYEGRETHDLGGRFVVPGLIDTHIHIESTLSLPYELARVIVPKGTTTLVADPHEIANVCGLEGIRFMLEASEGLPLDCLFMLPSCVPASPLSSGGAALEAADLQKLWGTHPRILGLAEFMNVPGAVLGDPQCLDKLMAFQGERIDGHAPGLDGKWLQAYAVAGPATDHESTTAEEALEKLRAGLHVLVREGTVTRDLEALLPVINEKTAPRMAFCTDDRHPEDLLDEGHLDFVVRRAIELGLDPVAAIQMATLGAANAHRLRDRGAIAPGRRADLVVTSRLEDFRAERVYALGRWVAENGEPVGHWPHPQADQRRVRNSVRVDLSRVSLDIPAQGSRVRAIGVVPRKVVTEERIRPARVVNGLAQADPENDLLKLAVVNRYGARSVGLGFVHGLGLRRGAIAGTVGHDSHNLTCAGADDESMLTAMRALAEVGGGYAVALGKEVLALTPLPIAGLMSDKPMPEIRAEMDRLLAATKQLGATLHDPMMHVAFLPLEVIPKLKLTDKGLVDVEKFGFVSLWV